MGATIIPSKSFSMPKPTMVPVTSQQSHHTSKEIHHYIPMTSSKHPQTSGASIFDLLTPQISRRTNPHLSIHQSRISRTISLTTVFRGIAPPLLRTQPPHVSRDISILTTTYPSTSQTFDPTRRRSSVLLTKSGRLKTMHRACC